jgi:hypothetical protein
MHMSVYGMSPSPSSGWHSDFEVQGSILGPKACYHDFCHVFFFQYLHASAGIVP